MREPESPVGWMLVTACLILAALHLAITVSTLLSSSLIHPLHDQFRLNLRYLTEPFPHSVLMLENGHRPVLPGVARVAELKWLGGWQWIQFITAWGLAIACTTILVRDMCKAWSPMLCAAGSTITVLLLWWTAHARMFIHVYEAVHLFYIVGGLIAALCIVHAAAQRGWPGWWHLSWVACVAAAFSFGPGIATFAGLLAAAWRLRAPLHVLVMICMATSITAWCYMYALPGAEGVRNASGGFAFGPAVFHLLARLGAPAHEMLRAFGAPTAVAAAAACLSGLMVATVIVGLTGSLLRERRLVSRIGLLGLGLLVFGFCANALIAINRTAYFLDYPDQLFADRYLFWASVGWLGAVICLLEHLAGWKPAFQFAAALATGVLSAIALPAAVELSGWSAEVYRHVERTAVGMQIKAASDQEIAAIADAGVPVAIRAVERMGERQLAGYHHVPGQRLLLQMPITAEELPALALSSSSERPHFGGKLPKKLARKLRHDWLWIVDAHGTPLGLAALTYSVRGPRNPLRIGMPTLDGLEGYWIGRPAEASWLGTREGLSLRVVASVRQQSLSQAGSR